jgi:DNA-binding response OmpR family regulator
LTGSGEQAPELFQTDRFDLVLLDLILPGINSIEVCMQIRDQSDVPILVLNARDEERRNSLATGFFAGRAANPRS